MPERPLDPVMNKVRAIVEKREISLQELGEKMNYGKGIARQSAWQFLNTKDPHISMLRRFAKAVEVPLQDLLGESAPRTVKKPR